MNREHGCGFVELTDKDTGLKVLVGIKDFESIEQQEDYNKKYYTEIYFKWHSVKVKESYEEIKDMIMNDIRGEYETQM